MCLSPGKILEKSWEFVSEKGYEPCVNKRRQSQVNLKSK